MDSTAEQIRSLQSMLKLCWDQSRFCAPTDVGTRAKEGRSRLDTAGFEPPGKTYEPQGANGLVFDDASTACGNSSTVSPTESSISGIDKSPAYEDCDDRTNANHGLRMENPCPDLKSEKTMVYRRVNFYMQQCNSRRILRNADELLFLILDYRDLLRSWPHMTRIEIDMLLEESMEIGDYEAEPFAYFEVATQWDVLQDVLIGASENSRPRPLKQKLSL